MNRDVDFVVENPQFSLKDGEFMFDTWTGLVWPVTDEGKLSVMDDAVHITDVTDEFMESLDNVINTCDLEDYINVYNIITKKLKEKRNYFNSDKDLVNKIELLTELEFKKKIN